MTYFSPLKVIIYCIGQGPPDFVICCKKFIFHACKERGFMVELRICRENAAFVERALY